MDNIWNMVFLYNVIIFGTDLNGRMLDSSWDLGFFWDAIQQRQVSLLEKNIFHHVGSLDMGDLMGERCG